MGRQNAALFAFNRGVVSPQALSRVDLERMRLSAEMQTNWVPRSVGSMTLRPGLGYINETYNSAKTRDIPFVYSVDDLAILECTNGQMRPLIDDEPITRASVSTAFVNGDFSVGTDWTFTNVGGGVAQIAAGDLVIGSVALESYATAAQTLAIAAQDQNVEHGVRITVSRGPVLFKIGSSSGGEQYVAQTVLATGVHSIAFTPTGANAYVTFEGRLARNVLVSSIAIEAAGEVTLPAFWDNDDLDNLKWAQSGNDIFIACYGHKPAKIERRGTGGARSWSVVDYDSYDGPFQGYTADSSVRLHVEAGSGLTNLVSSRPFFTSNHNGAKFRVFTPGYNFSYSLAQADVFTPAVRVSGVGASARTVSIVTTGTWVGTLTVQKSFVSAVAGFTDTSTTINTNTTTSFAESSDNVICWVRVGFKESAYTSGTAIVQPIYGIGGTGGGGTETKDTGSVQTGVGGRYGICEVYSVTNETTAAVQVFSYFTSDEKSDIWYQGEWSDYLGWPSAVGFHEGRLCWAGRDRLWGTISDSYYSFNPAQEGDSGPIQRSIGYGPVQIINWIASSSRLVLGAEGSEVAAKSSNFDEPLSPTNFSLKDFSNIGSARVTAEKIDQRIVFVKKGGRRLMEAAYSVESQDFRTNDLMRIVPDLCIDSPIVKVIVQRQPDTRIHCIREDGTVAILLYEPSEEVQAWIEFETDGIVEDGCVLPGDIEDQVTYIVKRTIDGNTVRYRERWAREDECIGETVTKLADSHIVYSGVSTTTITGLDHLEGEEVVVWGNGKDLGTKTVSGGQITGLSEAVTSAVVGLYYRARFKSTKLAYAAQGGTALNQSKRVSQLGLVLYKTHYQGLRHGSDFDDMQSLPLVDEGAVIAADTIHDTLDMSMMEHDGLWSTDSRLCLEAAAPRPCTVLSAVIDITTNG